MTLPKRSFPHPSRFFVLLLCLSGLLLASCSRKMIQIEAANRCKCIKRVANEIDERARKSEAEGRRSSWSNPSYAQTVLKAGSEDCAALRRKSEHRGFVARMSREERSVYDQQVLEVMERKCPKRLERVEEEKE